MNKLLNYKTKTKNATPPIFTEIVALFFFTNCQRWDYNMYSKNCNSIFELFEKTMQNYQIDTYFFEKEILPKMKNCFSCIDCL